MIFSYLKVSWRNVIRNRGYSLINIIGLTTGMVTAILIGLWTHRELSYDTYHKHYSNLAQVMVQQPTDGGIDTYMSLPLPVSSVLRNDHSHNFESIAATWSSDQTLGSSGKMISSFGCFSEPSLPEMLTLQMLRGSHHALTDNNSIILSESVSMALFGETDVMGKIVSVSGGVELEVKGVYKDFPDNSSFSSIKFFGPIGLVVSNGVVNDNWLSSSFNIFVLMKPDADLRAASKNISDILKKNQSSNSNASLFLYPMSYWHFYNFDNGMRVDGRIQLVRIVVIIGFFVLVLACINFMNLTTARSEKRAKEVGIRKSIGSGRAQLMVQFYCETLLLVSMASVISIAILPVVLPAFNELTGNSHAILWREPVFWIVNVMLVFGLTAVAGSYPALYLSGFRVLKVLKGAYKTGRYGSLPRKALVVIQFSISVVLIIGTLTIYTQINYGKSRPVGYERHGLLSIPSPFAFEALANYEPFKNELTAVDGVTGIARSSSPTTNVFASADNLEWDGKASDIQTEFGTISVDPSFDQVVAWKIKAGRNFSGDHTSDSLAFIFNETAIRRMGLDDPINKTVRWHGKTWTIIGVVEDMVMNSPFGVVQPTVFMMNSLERPYSVINVKLGEDVNQQKTLARIEGVFRKFSPKTPFVWQLAEQSYALKFAEEERTSRLVSVLAILAIVISCLGLIGLASFVAGQRTKEIGVRKVVGATVFQIWHMITKEFILLVLLSSVLAIPVGSYFLNDWLQQYAYHTELSWWMLLTTLAISTSLAILSVGYQAIDAATANPVKSLRTE